ncbi:MAG: D-alanine--D-alanine ligase family protein [Thermodesulfobacteriota bacterium]
MSKKAVGLIHNVPVSPNQAFAAASADVLTQISSIEEALGALGYQSVRIPFTKEVNGFIAKMKEEGVEIAVNLCETVDEDPRFAGHPAALLELMDISFSGSPAMALMLTTDKALTKQLLRAHGIRTPAYLMYDGETDFDFQALKFPVILKPRFQDASIGIEQESIFLDDISFREGINGFLDRFGPLLAEEYIDGREFNVSVFGYPLPKALPLAEIDFSALPKGFFPIVGYRAKWDTSSFEYYHIPRKFPQSLSSSLRQEIEKTALECFSLLMLRDYGRIDIRVHDDGQIYVLEVNANPCLSPDAGLAAAAQQAGMSYTDIVETLMGFVEERNRNDGTSTCHTR